MPRLETSEAAFFIQANDNGTITVYATTHWRVEYEAGDSPAKPAIGDGLTVAALLRAAEIVLSDDQRDALLAAARDLAELPTTLQS